VNRRETLGLLLAGAAGTWLGSLALRAFLTMLVWSVVEDGEPEEVGAVALAVWLVGLLGWLPARYAGGVRPAWRLGLLVAGLSVARQAFPGEVASPAFAFAALAAWMWWLPTYLRELGQRGAAGLAAPAVVLGLIGQVGWQTAMHGMDLNMLVGPWSILGALVLVGALLVGLRVAPTPATLRTEAPGFGPLALWAYLFLQIELAANLGRLQLMADWEILPTAAAVGAGLLAGLALLFLRLGIVLRLALGLVAVGLLAAAPGLMGWGVLAVVPIQACLVPALDASFAPRRGRVYPWFVGGALLNFALIFIYYERDVLPVLWPAAAAVVVLASIRRSPTLPLPAGAARPVGALALAGLAGLAVSLIPYSSPASAPPSGELRVLQLNAHQNLDLWSAPNAQGIADLIEATGADLVALQEINRGWSISGGVDGVAWLRWRFPSFAVVYGPQHGDAFGNVVMSRHPLAAYGWDRLTRGRGEPPRGYAWAQVVAPGGELLFVSTHAASSARGAERLGRAPHSQDLLRFWGQRPRTVIAGDLNDRPETPAIAAFGAAGMQEALALRAPGRNLTQPALTPEKQIDYVFASPDVEILSAEVLATGASDHAPILATVRLR
jgi:endonuclease/exonuclease/phosphatase family metal-dependent hydrolase